MARKLTVYPDASVINFLYPEGTPSWLEETIDFFEHYIKPAVYQVFVSDFVLQEIKQTKNEDRRKRLLSVIEDYHLAFLDISNLDEIAGLADLYIQNGIVQTDRKADASHVAAAVVSSIDYLSSWDYRRLANVNCERKAYVLNLQENYLHPLRITVPLHLMDVED